MPERKGTISFPTLTKLSNWTMYNLPFSFNYFRGKKLILTHPRLFCFLPCHLNEHGLRLVFSFVFLYIDKPISLFFSFFPGTGKEACLKIRRPWVRRFFTFFRQSWIMFPKMEFASCYNETWLSSKRSYRDESLRVKTFIFIPIYLWIFKLFAKYCYSFRSQDKCMGEEEKLITWSYVNHTIIIL